MTPHRTATRTKLAVLLAGTLAAGLLAAGPATAAGGLTAGQVEQIAKKVAAKVVKKSAPTLKVGNSTMLAGKPATTYLERGIVYTATISTPVSTFEYGVPLAPGSYLVSYSAYLNGVLEGACYLALYQGNTPFLTTADSYARRGLTGSAIITVASNQKLTLYCAGDAPFTTYNSGGVTDPIRVSAVPLDSVQSGALTVAPRGTPRPGR